MKHLKPLRFGVIGLRFGANYLRVLHDMDSAEVEAVASRNRRSYENIRHLLRKEAKYYQNSEELIASRDIDCVVIASPPSTHLPYIRSARRHGKHVLVEKPAVTNASEARALRALVRSDKPCFMVGHLYLYNDYVNYLKRYIAEGWLGKICYAYFDITVLGPIRSDVECLWEIGTHHLSLFDYLFDAPDIKNVRGAGCDIKGKNGSDFISAEILYSNGVILYFMASWFFPRKEKKFVIVGTEGMAYLDDMASEKKLTIYKYPYPSKLNHLSHFFNLREGRKSFTPRIAANDPLSNELQHFVSCVRSGSQPLSGISEGFRVMKMLDTISRGIFYPS